MLIGRLTIRRWERRSSFALELATFQEPSFLLDEDGEYCDLSLEEQGIGRWGVDYVCEQSVLNAR